MLMLFSKASYLCCGPWQPTFSHVILCAVYAVLCIYGPYHPSIVLYAQLIAGDL